MNAKNVFDDVMKRCDEIIASESLAYRDDQLRLAVVLGVAAFERYVKDRFLMTFVKYLKGKMNEDGSLSLNDACKTLLGRSLVNDNFWVRAANKKAKRPYKMIYNKVRRYLYATPIQNEKKIHELYDCYGMGSVVANAVGKTERKAIWKSLEELIRRRHLIAHHCDMLTTGKVRRIDQQYVIRRLTDLKSFVDGMECVLSDRFPCRKKRTGNKMLSKDPHHYLAAYYLKKGCLNATEWSALKRISEIEKLFRTKAKRKGFLYEGIAPVPSAPAFELWWPQISSIPNYAGWKNVIKVDDDGMVAVIIEGNDKGSRKQRQMAIDRKCDLTRMVFAKIDGETCPFGYCYRFLGISKLDVEASRKSGECVWVRVETRCNIKAVCTGREGVS